MTKRKLDEIVKIDKYVSVSEFNQIKLIREKFDNNEEVNSVNEYNQSYLQVSTYKGDINVVKKILQKSNDFDIGTYKLDDILNDDEEGDIYSQNFIDVQNCNLTPLQIAAYRDHLDIVKLFVEFQYETENHKQLPFALLFAAANGNYEIVKFILSQGRMINGKNNLILPNTLLISVYKKHVHSPELLLENGANVDFLDIEGQTALHVATIIEREDIVELLIKYNADVNFMDNCYGDTPLHIAVRQNYLPIVKLLVKNNADYNLPNVEDLIAYDLAINVRNTNILNIFDEKK